MRIKDLAASRSGLVSYLISAFVLLFPVIAVMFRESMSVFILIASLYGAYLIFGKNRLNIFAENYALKLYAIFGISAVVWSIISMMVNVDLSLIHSDELEYIDKQIRFLFFVPLVFIFTKSTISEKPIWWGAIIAASASGLYSVGYSILFTCDARVFAGEEGNPITYAYFALTSAFISINAVPFFRKYSRKIFLVFPLSAFCLGMIATILSGSRGAWLALPVLVILTAINLRHQMKRKYMAVFVLVLLSFLTVSILGNKILRERVGGVWEGAKKYFSESESNSSSRIRGNMSVGGRLEMFRVALSIATENPFFGVGPGRYQTKAMEYVDAGRADPAIKKFRYPHNDYLTAATCGGFPGLIIFVMTAFILPFFVIWQASGKDMNNSLMWAGMILITGFMIFALSNSVLFKNIRIHYYYLILAAIAAGMMHKSDASGPVCDPTSCQNSSI